MQLIKKDIPFTQIANEILRRKDLSMKAKGMFAYLFSKPGDWDFAADRIARESLEGRKAILTMLKELEIVGLLFRKKLGDGRVEYHITYSIESQSPKSGLRDRKPKSHNGTVAKRHRAEKASISNTDGASANKTDINTNTDSARAPKEETKLFFEEIIKASSDKGHPLAPEPKDILNWLMATTGVSKSDIWKEVQKFSLYWTEPTQTGKRQRWETEKTFEIKRRLLTWFTRAFASVKTNIKNRQQEVIM